MIELTNRQIQRIKNYVSSSQNESNDNDKLTSFELSTNRFTYQINSILRSNLETVNLEEYLTELDNAFENYETTEETTVYRVCNYKEMLRYLENENYIDLGYMSTTSEPENTQGFYQNQTFGYFPAFLKINIPIGTNVLPLDNIANYQNNTYENEILIKRKAIFQVLDNREIETNTNEELFGRENIEQIPRIRILEMNFIRYAE